MVNWEWGDVLEHDAMGKEVKAWITWHLVGYDSEFATQIKSKGKAKRIHVSHI